MENSLEKKNSVKFCTKMPLVPTGQEFRPECNVAIFPWKHVGSIFSDLRNTWKILFKKIENKKGKVCKKMPSCPTGQEFCPGYNDGIFAPKLADSIFSGQIKKWKILSKEKKIR